MRYFFLIVVCWFTLLQTAHGALPFSAFDKDVPTLAPLLEKVIPGVVNISTTGSVKKSATHPLLDDPLFKRFFGQRPPMEDNMQKKQRVQGIGSGVIVDAKKGYILTNHHVIKDADTIYVGLKDKRRFTAEVIGTDPDTDVAVLKVDASDLSEIKMGNSDKVRVGDFAIAIGNPFRLSHTVTSGIVSAVGRSGLGIENYENFIQTDASINQGNSGGALLNLKGELIGINTAIIGKQGGSVGIGFAIPVNMAKHVMDQLVEHGKIERGQLGVHIQDITHEIADVMGLKTNEGALVAKVVPGSAAAKAGVQIGDVIVGYNGQAVDGASSLKNMVGVSGVGDKTSVEILRDGKRKTLTVYVGKRDEMTLAQPGTSHNIPFLSGAKIALISPEHPLYGEVEGLEVTEVQLNSHSWEMGIEKGDIIVSANRTRVKTVADLAKVAKGATKGLLLNVRRGSSALFIAIGKE